MCCNGYILLTLLIVAMNKSLYLNTYTNVAYSVTTKTFVKLIVINCIGEGDYGNLCLKSSQFTGNK